MKDTSMTKVRRFLSAAVFTFLAAQALLLIVITLVKNPQKAIDWVLSREIALTSLVFAIAVQAVTYSLYASKPQRQGQAKPAARTYWTQAGKRNAAKGQHLEPLTEAQADALQYAQVMSLMPYEPKYLMTYREQRFFLALIDALRILKKDFTITVKPSIKEFVQVPDYESDDVHKRAWREISQKHVDFLVCNTSGYPVAAIEYDDSSHDKDNPQNERTIRSDEFKNVLFSKLQIPLVRISYGDWTGQTLIPCLPLSWSVGEKPEQKVRL